MGLKKNSPYTNFILDKVMLITQRKTLRNLLKDALVNQLNACYFSLLLADEGSYSGLSCLFTKQIIMFYPNPYNSESKYSEKQ